MHIFYLFANRILFCYMYTNVFLFSLLFNYDSSVDFKVISSLNITTQPIATTKKTVGSSKKPYDYYQLPCWIVSTMFFIFCHLYFSSPIVSIFYYCCLLLLYNHSFRFISLRLVYLKYKISKANKWFKQTQCVRYFS